MIIGDKREQVIENIQLAVENGTFHAKVEVDDPVLTAEQKKLLLERYLKKRPTLRFRINNLVARQIANGASRKLNQATEIVGLENVSGITRGAIVTSNHFSPVDNTIVRMMALKNSRKRLCVASQDSNYAMRGWLGYMMRYADTFPISTDAHYLTKQFEPLLENLLGQKNFVLIYPEQEMWFNYRKPRPLKRGVYYYAAKLHVPVISCFVEIRDSDETDIPGFHKVNYILHVLPTILPDPAKTVRENSFAMCHQDYLQKQRAYEAAYGKPLNYHFKPEDIAGWIQTAAVE